MEHIVTSSRSRPLPKKRKPGCDAGLSVCFYYSRSGHNSPPDHFSGSVFWIGDAVSHSSLNHPIERNPRSMGTPARAQDGAPPVLFRYVAGIERQRHGWATRRWPLHRQGPRTPVRLSTAIRSGYRASRRVGRSSGLSFAEAAVCRCAAFVFPRPVYRVFRA
jgi:hypothetical protein